MSTLGKAKAKGVNPNRKTRAAPGSRGAGTVGATYLRNQEGYCGACRFHRQGSSGQWATTEGQLPHQLVLLYLSIPLDPDAEVQREVRWGHDIVLLHHCARRVSVKSIFRKSHGNGIHMTVAGLRSWKLQVQVLHMGGLHKMVSLLTEQQQTGAAM